MKVQLGILIAVLAIALLGILAYTSMQQTGQNRVEVCIAYNGKTECRVASGATKEEAQRTATETACAVLASGMTDSMACGRTTPVSVKPLQ